MMRSSGVPTRIKPSPCHHPYPVPQAEGFPDIMGDEQDGLVDVRLYAKELFLELLAEHGVECAERLVHEEQRGVHGQ